MKVAGQIKISPNILQNATKKKPTIESQERDQQKIECISHLVPEKKKKKKRNIIQFKALEYKVGTYGLLFSWYTLSIKNFLRSHNGKFWH